MSKMDMMAGKNQQIILVVIFLIVLVPAVILCYFAFQAVNQEEVVQRRRLEDSLFLELDQTNSRIQFYLDEMVDDLYDSLPDDYDKSELYLNRWMAEQPLVGTAYSLNEDGSIAFPPIDESDEANLFYWRYLNFFSNKESIPIYQNIVEEYQEEILSDDESWSVEKIQDFDRMAAPKEESSVSEGADDEVLAGAFEMAEADMAAPMMESAAPDLGKAALSEDNSRFLAKKSYAEEAPAPIVSQSAVPDSLLTKEAEGLFESDSAVQERVYDLAEQDGQQYLQRNFMPQLSLTPREEEPQSVVRSVYMESTRYFEEIVASGTHGIIPRLFDSTFILLFWAKQGDVIVGCELNMSLVESRLVEAIGTPGNGVRYLNILDNGGRPLISLSDLSNDQWRRPFVAKEISEILPYWETAILLRSPEEFQRQIDSSKYILTLLILFLAALVLVGMMVIYQISASQLRDVQQRVSFVTNVSHELKTPLTSIRLYSEMLSEGFQTDPGKITKYSGYIASESQRLTRLINNVLDFAKLEKGTKVINRRMIDLTALAGEIHSDLKDEYGKLGFTFTLHLPDEPIMVEADREAVMQVIINLLSNGVKYSEKIKEISLEVCRREGEILVHVHDRGIGIPRKFRKKIFREFFRVDTSITASHNGTGLGLAIARNIMKGHGGDLVYAPRDKGHNQGGSTFTMIFPGPTERGPTEPNREQKD